MTVWKNSGGGRIGEVAYFDIGKVTYILIGPIDYVAGGELSMHGTTSELKNGSLPVHSDKADFRELAARARGAHGKMGKRNALAHRLAGFSSSSGREKA